MPVNGLILAAEILQLGIQIDGTWSGGAAQLLEGLLESLWTPDAVNVVPGASIHIAGNSLDGGGTVNFQCPNAPFGGFTQAFSGIPSNISANFNFNNYQLYAVNPLGENYLWHVFWDSIDLQVNDVTVATLAGANFVSNALGPSWVPIFCGMVGMSGGAGTIGNGSATGTISRGYRFKINGSWVALPTAVPPLVDAPQCGVGTDMHFHPVTECSPFGLSLSQSVVSTSTWGTQLTNSGFIPGSGPDYDVHGNTGTLILVPNLPKSIERLNTDFAAGFFRFATPLVTGASTRGFEHGEPGSGYLVTTHGGNSVYARQAPGAQEVGPTQSALEAYFSQPTYVMCTTQNSRTRQSGGVFDTEALQTIFPAHVDGSSDALIAPYMDHLDIRARYFNSAVCHPHWSIGYTTGPWNLYGGPEYWPVYWGPEREQYLSAQKRRNHIISCPLESSGYTPFLGTFFVNPGTNQAMAWIGVSRWQTQTFTPPTSLTLDSTSAPAWSAVGGSCTLTFGADVQIDSVSSANPVTFDLDLARFDCPPYLYAQLAKSVFLNWPLTNIDSVKVYALSVDGTTSKLLTVDPADVNTTPDKTYPMPNVTDAKYGGSWGSDNGNFIATDTGIDVAAGGISAALMNDVRRQVGFGFLGEQQAVALRFVLEFTDPTLPAKIHYPRFTAATLRLNVQENGQVCDSIYANGPGIRLGNHVWYTGIFNNPPLYSGLGYKGTVIDWLADRRTLQGVSPTGGTPSLATECTQLYNSFEGNSIGQVDRASIYFILPQSPSAPNEASYKAALVNTWSETPPLAVFPTFDRDPKTWNQNTTPVQKTWAYCQLPRRFVNPNVNADLTKPDGTMVSGPSTLAAPAGWRIRDASPIVDNSEGVDWWIVSGGKRWANVTPWHGYLSVLVARSGGKGIDLVETLDGELMVVGITEEDVQIWYCSLADPSLGFNWSPVITTDGGWSAPAVCQDSQGQFELRATQTVAGVASTYRLWSNSKGQTWQPVSLGVLDPELVLANSTESKVRCSVDGDMLEMTFVPDTGLTGVGKFSARWKGSGDADFGSPFTPSISTGGDLRSDGSGFGHDHANEGPDRWFLAMVKEGETAIGTLWSGDQGRSWKAV